MAGLLRAASTPIRRRNPRRRRNTCAGRYISGSTQASEIYPGPGYYTESAGLLLRLLRKQSPAEAAGSLAQRGDNRTRGSIATDHLRRVRPFHVNCAGDRALRRITRASKRPPRKRRGRQTTDLRKVGVDGAVRMIKSSMDLIGASIVVLLPIGYLPHHAYDPVPAGSESARRCLGQQHLLRSALLRIRGIAGLSPLVGAFRQSKKEIRRNRNKTV
jgi:hypothetical protein